MKKNISMIILVILFFALGIISICENNSRVKAQEEQMAQHEFEIVYYEAWLDFVELKYNIDMDDWAFDEFELWLYENHRELFDKFVMKEELK